MPPANLRVVFILQELRNDVVSGGGVSDPAMAEWHGQNPVATQEKAGPFTLPAPGPGEVWPLDHANGIYQVLTLGGCQQAIGFPVSLNTRIREFNPVTFEFGEQLGQASPSDEDTINSSGFYRFTYAVRATSTAGGVSDFGFSGTVAVRCVQDTELG